MATTLVEARGGKGESRADQERQYEHHEDHVSREIGHIEPVCATQEMCAYCFDVLVSHFKGEAEPSPSFPTEYTCGLFVTWDKHSSRGGYNLRGCIGTLSPMPISWLKDYTYSSAFRDRRFSPIVQSELPRLQCGVSLLVDYEPARHSEDWEVGVHGIIINFTAGPGEEQFSATYLPEVAAEQGWTKKEALSKLARKAGYEGQISQAFLSTISVTRYKSSKCRLSYQDYEALFAAKPGGKPSGRGGARGSGGDGGGGSDSRRDYDPPARRSSRRAI